MEGFKEALNDLRLGEVIAYPSEGVWGLGCDPRNKKAVLKLLNLKKRPMDKGLILVASNISQMEPYIDLRKYKTKLKNFEAKYESSVKKRRLNKKITILESSVHAIN